ncbi:MAG TPA: metallophosphoesterase [Thermomicrobiales bacterium]|nr:metallophosphoesterase [Thermomicrobiales bacterium]
MAGLAAGLATGVGVAYAARFIAPYRPALERVSLPLPPGHERLAGLRIGFVTDTHVGPLMSPAQIERALDLLASGRPDLALFGGDYISDSPRYAERAATILGRFAASTPLGGVAVLGNHDIANDGERMAAVLRQEGIRVLRNEPIAIPVNGATLWIAGIDESILANACPDAAFAGIPPGAAALALWHEPDDAVESAKRGAFAQLSGHSHGGQVRLPVVGAPFAPTGGRRYVSGLNRVAGMPIYTSRGLGTYRPPLRFNCPPEVTLLTLVAEDGD